MSSIGLNSVGFNAGALSSSLGTGGSGIKPNSSNMNDQGNLSRIPHNVGHISNGPNQQFMPNTHHSNGQSTIPGTNALPFVPRIFDLNHRLFIWQLHLLANGGNPGLAAAAHNANQLSYLQNHVKNQLLNSPFSCSIQSNNLSPSSSASSSPSSRMADLQHEINARRAVKIWRTWNE